MKHTIKLTAPFIATIDDEKPLGARAMALFATDPTLVAKLIMSSTLLTQEFDDYMAAMNKREDDTPHAVFVTLDKPAFI